ncbi:Hypp3721 [Branchiostoma lanceolatum]|uniref:Hypp3721 protein n=1 Tax=Branchiostoma lanceolatum TaxID=7740 RepID=A0A8K0A3R6_BRALA|nr:Hypp3721 [Branchiostoma lanceolatum]
MSPPHLAWPVVCVLLLGVGVSLTTQEEVYSLGHIEDNRCVCTFVAPYNQPDSPTKTAREAPSNCPSLDASELQRLKDDVVLVHRHQLANREQLNTQSTGLFNLTTRMHTYEESLRKYARRQVAQDGNMGGFQKETRKLRRLITKQRQALSGMRSRVDSLTNDLEHMRGVNEQLLLELQVQAEKNEMQRRRLEDLRVKHEATETQIQEFLWIVTTVLKTVPRPDREQLGETGGTEGDPERAEPPGHRPGSPPETAEENTDGSAEGSQAGVDVDEFDDLYDDLYITPKPRRRRFQKAKPII